MVLIPQRLFDSPQVTILLRAGNVCILEKKLAQPIVKKAGYISNHVIVVLLAGEQHIETYDGEIIKVKAKEILFIPRGLYYITDLLPTTASFRSVLFYFDDALIQEFLSTITISTISRTAVPNHLKLGIVPSVEQFTQSLLQLYPHPQLQHQKIVQLKILELLYLLNSLVPQQHFADFLFRLTLPQKRNIKTFIDHNFDKPLKVEDYAYLTGRSVSTFRRDFKAYYNTTPQKWLQEKRLDKALTILKTRKISVTQLAYEVGYENISYFIKAFKEYVGQSPKQYILTQHRDKLLN